LTSWQRDLKNEPDPLSAPPELSEWFWPPLVHDCPVEQRLSVASSDNEIELVRFGVAGSPGTQGWVVHLTQAKPIESFEPYAQVIEQREHISVVHHAPPPASPATMLSHKPPGIFEWPLGGHRASQDRAARFALAELPAWYC
jgi:hypothetical protein